jgi:hypothetical protein
MPVYRLMAEMPAQEFGRWLAHFDLQQQDREMPADKRQALEQWFELE